MNNAMKLTAAYLDSLNFFYEADEQNSVISTGMGGFENKQTVKVLIFFDDNDRTIGIRSFEYVSFPAAKRDEMYKVCSDMNEEYRWAKFYVEKERDSVTISDDAVISLDSCGEEVLELVSRLCNIADDAYPKFMRAIW